MGTRETAAGQGALTGAAAGSQVMPGWGTAIGAGIGGIMGYVGASQQEKKNKQAHAEQEEFRRQQNKYAAFFGKQPTMERARVSQSAVPQMMSGLTQGAYTGGMIGNMYSDKNKPNRFDPNTGKPINQFDPQTGEPITNFYAEG